MFDSLLNSKMASLNTRSQSALPSETSKPMVSCPVLLISSSHGALDGGLSSAIAHLTQVERLASVDGKISANGIEPDAPRYMPRSDADACPAHIPRMALETPWKRDINL